MAVTNDRIISVWADDGQTLHCQRCETSLHIEDVAMLIRTDPVEAFSAWCPHCTLVITYHAAHDLGFIDVESII